MKLALCMTVRDEADIIERTIRWHFSHGVDLVFVEESNSTDDTPAILDRLAATLPVYAWHTRRPHSAQHRAMTELQGKALELGADWVINADADEFWLADEGDLKTTIAKVPAGVSHVRAQVDELRADLSLIPGHKGWGGRLAQPKAAHRPGKRAQVLFGNVWVNGVGMPAEVGVTALHLPFRSLAQATQKGGRMAERIPFRSRARQADYEALRNDPAIALRGSGVADPRLARILQPL
jgi:hypothetical protein